MPCSMTAFAHLKQTTAIGVVECRLRTLNSRYLDLHLHLADALYTVEGKIRERLSARLKRGRIECHVQLEEAGEAAELVINQAVARRVLSACKQIALHAGQSTAINPMHVLRWPGVIQPPLRQQHLQSADSVVLPIVEQVVNALINARQREGEALAARLRERCDAIDSIVTALRRKLPDLIERQRDRLQQRLKVLLSAVDQHPVSELRTDQEIAILAQKADITEELDRLDTHLIEVRRLLSSNAAVGRQLEFLVQELNREANTLGAKSNAIETSHAAIELKLLIDQLREQVLNIE